MSYTLTRERLSLQDEISQLCSVALREPWKPPAVMGKVDSKDSRSRTPDKMP